MVIVTTRRVTAGTTLVVVGALAYFLPSLISWEPGTRANFWVLVLTAGAALWYAWLAYLLLRGEQRPVVVAAYEEGRTVIRNFGRGAALNVSLTAEDGRVFARGGDLAPTGTGYIQSQIDWTIDEARYLFFQDVVGRWYGTKCLGQSLGKAAYLPVANVFLGRVFNPPSDARKAALVRSAVEHWVQLNRSWDPRNWLRVGIWTFKKWRAERRIVELVKAAIREGRLSDTFSPAEVSAATDLERVVADRFVPNHAVGSAAGEREFFVQESANRFRLKMRGE
jgi:hypothetical protein